MLAHVEAKTRFSPRPDQPSCDSNIGVVINDAKFGVCMLIEEFSLKVVNHKIACSVANIHQIEKKTYFLE